MTMLQQIFWLLMLAVPIACVARTVVYEEIFREPREYCQRQSKGARSVVIRKFFYLFTCEYCFSHYVTVFFLIFTAVGPGPGFRLLLPDWRGYVLAFFALVMVANISMNLYARLRVDITQAKVETKKIEKEAARAAAEADRIAQETNGSAGSNRSR